MMDDGGLCLSRCHCCFTELIPSDLNTYKSHDLYHTVLTGHVIWCVLCSPFILAYLGADLKVISSFWLGVYVSRYQIQALSEPTALDTTSIQIIATSDSTLHLSFITSQYGTWPCIGKLWKMEAFCYMHISFLMYVVMKWVIQTFWIVT